MSREEERPARLSCGHCGASTALSWAPIGGGDWVGSGRCPSCRYLVTSFAFRSVVRLDEFLLILPRLLKPSTLLRDGVPS